MLTVRNIGLGYNRCLLRLIKVSWDVPSTEVFGSLSLLGAFILDDEGLY